MGTSPTSLSGLLLETYAIMTTNIHLILEREHLDNLIPLFEKQGVTDEILDTITDEDLQTLGVDKLGDRRRVLLAFGDGTGGPFDLTAMAQVGGGLLPQDSEFSGQKVEPFRIGKYPVTQLEWERIRIWAMAHGFKLEAGEGNGSRHPITHVSWYDAIKWCNAKSAMEGLKPIYSINGKIYQNGEYGPDSSTLVEMNAAADGYRLPTEMEWEWAARGGTLSQGYQFSGSDNPDKVAWHEKNSNGGAHPVGQKQPNELGIHDMSGNVWEWCWDKDETGSACRIRGGSWMQLDGHGTVAYRVSRSPDSRYTVIGFRVARNL
jgi:formylglycine-generating enzyme required for sulfatase activity